MKNDALEKFRELLDIMNTLRSEGGCPWDREQTHETLRPYLIEESHEVIEAINEKSPEHLAEELGDLLLQIVFHAQIARESGRFDISDVLNAINRKLIRRHPHVFGDVSVSNAEQVLENWQKIKKSEKKSKADQEIFADIPKNLPQLVYAKKIQDKAAALRFEWDTISQVKAKVIEEWNELWSDIDSGSDQQDIEDELGDVLFALVNLSRFLNLDAEEALRRGNEKFKRRFRALLRKVGGEPGLRRMNLAEMDAVWDQVKIEERSTPV